MNQFFQKIVILEHMPLLCAFYQAFRARLRFHFDDIYNGQIKMHC